MTGRPGRPGALDDDADDAARVGRRPAGHVAAAVAGPRQVRGTARALATRHVVGRAEGVLVERREVTADQAFVLLTQVPRTTDRRLVDVAGELTAGGRLGG